MSHNSLDSFIPVLKPLTIFIYKVPNMLDRLTSSIINRNGLKTYCFVPYYTVNASKIFIIKNYKVKNDCKIFSVYSLSGCMPSLPKYFLKLC